MCTAVIETKNAFVNDIGNECFAILVDESQDVSTKEHMAIVLRCVDKIVMLLSVFFKYNILIKLVS